MTGKEIIAKLPYDEPFLFVDALHSIDARSVVGTYRFREEADFYRGHFKDNPITPGVILLECMAQIALVCQGIFLLDSLEKPIPKAVAFSSANVDFLKPVLPGEEVTVRGEVEYFRMGKLKSNATLSCGEQLVCKAGLSGMVSK